MEQKGYYSNAFSELGTEKTRVVAFLLFLVLPLKFSGTTARKVQVDHLTRSDFVRILSTRGRLQATLTRPGLTHSPADFYRTFFSI